MSKNVEISYKGEDGGYETLYPRTTGDMVEVSGEYQGVLNEALTAINLEIKSVIAPELIITTTPGASVTATSENGGVSGNADNEGNCVLKLPDYGNYTVVASLMGVSQQGEIAVDTTKQYPMSLILTNIFENLSWSNINSLLAQGNANVFNVGDVKPFVLNGTAGSLSFNNTQAYATIIGINHNSSIEGSNLLHIQIALNNTNTAVVGRSGIDLSTNKEGWVNSRGRTVVCAQLLNCLPDELRSVVKTITKYTGKGISDPSITPSSDTIFLPSEFEIRGVREYSSPREESYQMQYAWYTSHLKDKILLPGGSRIDYWTRSPYSITSSSVDYCEINSSGTATYNDPTRELGFAPCFCI